MYARAVKAVSCLGADCCCCRPTLTLPPPLTVVYFVAKYIYIGQNQVAATLHEMGVTAFEATQMIQAEGYFRRALEIKDCGAKEPSLDTAYTLHDLGGVVLASGGTTAEAEALFLRALEIRERLGASLDAASTLHCLGECARKRSGGGDRTRKEEQEERSGDRSTPRSALEEAEGFYRRALELQEKVLGPNHLYVAHTLFQLGLCLCSSPSSSSASSSSSLFSSGEVGDIDIDNDNDKKKSDEAVAVFARSLAVREKELGRNHEDVLRTLHHLAACASRAGRVEEAEGWYRRVVAAEELTLGADHPAVARTLHQLGACVLKAGKVDDGVGLLRRSLDIPEEEPALEETAGGGGGGGGVKGGPKRGRRRTDHHLDVALTLQQLAVCAADAGRVAEADSLFRGVLAIEERKLGANHPVSCGRGLAWRGSWRGVASCARAGARSSLSSSGSSSLVVPRRCRPGAIVVVAVTCRRTRLTDSILEYANQPHTV